MSESARSAMNKLLIHCSRVNPTDNEAEVEGILTGSVDWSYIIQRAAENYVFPQVYHNLIARRVEIEDASLLRMRGLYHQFTAGSMLWFKEARKILNRLRAEEVNLMVIKGLLLSETAYPKRHLRFSQDFDFLFSSDEERRIAEEQIVKMGYHREFSSPKETSLHKLIGRLSVHCELHSFISVFGSFEYPRLDGVWETAEKTTIGGVEVASPSLENQFLILCLHSFRHGHFSLRDLCDAEVILKNRPGFNWRLLLECASKDSMWRYVLSIPVYLIATIQRDLFHEKLIPDKVLQALGGNNMEFQISEKVVREIMNRTAFQFPLPQRVFCTCRHCRYCPLVLNKLAPLYMKPPQWGWSFYFLRYLLELFFSLSFVRRSYGIISATKSVVGLNHAFLTRLSTPSPPS